MKDVKLKERFEKSFEAFFDNKKSDENDSLEFVHQETTSTVEESSIFSEKTRTVFNLLRQAFLFLPASFLLFFGSTAMTVRFLTMEGEGVVAVSIIQLILLLGVALVTILGLGDLRKLKHLSIPLSIFSLGVIVGIIGSVFANLFGFNIFNVHLIPYFFPLALITAILTKTWVDNLNENN